MSYTESAYAKLNLTLDILGRRPDGYHEMKMIMLAVDLADQVSLSPREDGVLTVETALPFLPRDDGNIAAKAARAFFAALGRPCPGFTIAIDKQIPVCAGMAGGSSDGAAVLRVLRRAYAPGMPQEELETIAARVGSDVPFCVRGGSALAQGRGEILTDLPLPPPCRLVVCKPSFSISTPELFAQVRMKKLRCHPDTAGMLAALEAEDLEGMARRVYNVFEDVLPRRFSQVFQIKGNLLELGAMAASMTGSGPTVFGIFRDEETARRAAEVLRPHFPTTFVCSPVGGAL